MAKKVSIKPKFLYDKTGNPAEVVLVMREFDALIERIEDLEDSLIACKIANKKQKTYPLEEVQKMFGLTGKILMQRELRSSASGCAKIAASKTRLAKK